MMRRRWSECLDYSGVDNSCTVALPGVVGKLAIAREADVIHTELL